MKWKLASLFGSTPSSPTPGPTSPSPSPLPPEPDPELETANKQIVGFLLNQQSRPPSLLPGPLASQASVGQPQSGGLSGISISVPSHHLFPVTPPEYVVETEPRTKLVIGYRSWNVRVLATGKVELYSLNTGGQGQPIIWPYAAPIRAYCSRMTRHDTQAPQAFCSCGIYAWQTLQGIYEYSTRGGHRVYGQVGLWGRIVETENGYRAEYAYPLALTVKALRPMPGFPIKRWVDLAKKLSEDYEVPVRVQE